jgi:ABC-2 type transport system ATP-binding protein
MSSVDVSHVSKSFGNRQAITDVTFSVRGGEVLGLLGPNGSGKSTLMKTIVGIIKPDAGSINVLGTDVASDPVAIKGMIGYVPEAPRLYEFLSGVEYLDFVADIHGLAKGERQERILEFLKALDLEGRENELIHGYSQGMKQKLAIIAALLHHPRVLILDEPLNALDPRSARIVKEVLHRFRGNGIPTIFSTHVLEIAEAMCDRIIIMDGGRLIAEGTTQELKTKAGSAGSTLEDIFLKLTGTSDTRDLVEALGR